MPLLLLCSTGRLSLYLAFFFFVCLLLLHSAVWSILYCLPHQQFYMQYVLSVRATCNTATCSISANIWWIYFVWNTRSRHTSSRPYGCGAKQCLKLLSFKNVLFSSFSFVAQLFVYLFDQSRDRLFRTQLDFDFEIDRICGVFSSHSHDSSELCI